MQDPSSFGFFCVVPAVPGIPPDLRGSVSSPGFILNSESPATFLPGRQLTPKGHYHHRCWPTISASRPWLQGQKGHALLEIPGKATAWVLPREDFSTGSSQSS